MSLSQAVYVNMLHLPSDYINKGACIIYVYITELIQYEQIHFHPFILYPNRAVEGSWCSWDVA